LCDDRACEGWLVCAACVVAAGVGMAEGQAVPLLCPTHQIHAYLRQAEVETGLARAKQHKPGTIGRLLGILTAFASRVAMSEALAVAPALEYDDTIPKELRREATLATEVAWDDSRRARIKGVSHKHLWLAAKLKALDLDVQHIRLLAEAYCRHRLSDDRPPGWLPCAARHVKSELAAVNRAADDLSITIAPYLGAKRVLELRGAFAPIEHSKRFPLIPSVILKFIDQVPRPRRSTVQQACDALEWNAFWGLRPLYLEAMSKANFMFHNGGFIMKWNKATKTKRGDRAAGAEAGLPTPQIAAARHSRLQRLYDSMPEEGTPFKGYRAEALKLLKEWFSGDNAIPDCFVLGLAGQRNGVDMTMLALGVPPDYVDAHLWWARAKRAMRAYYAGLQASLTMHATDLFERVLLKPLAPGWYDKVLMPPAVDWTALQAIPDAVIDSIPTTAVQDLPEEEEDIGPMPTVAPKGAPPVRARLRQGKPVAV